MAGQDRQTPFGLAKTQLQNCEHDYFTDTDDIKEQILKSALPEETFHLQVPYLLSFFNVDEITELNELYRNLLIRKLITNKQSSNFITHLRK